MQFHTSRKMESTIEQVMTLKVRGEACDQLQAMAEEGDRTLTAQLQRTIRRDYARFMQEVAE